MKDDTRDTPIARSNDNMIHFVIPWDPPGVSEEMMPSRLNVGRHD